MRHQNWKQSVISCPGFESRSFSGFHCRPHSTTASMSTQNLVHRPRDGGLEGYSIDSVWQRPSS
ncbi:hypothetical protein JG688_00014356 [Phytophthora aleatoria]|uniref:Uncharacterized protein n=1 Tax=Phytophthora aleatoria TaxID=2496075 RepID=A0A8J5M0H3_9STRA|nr:hypothetical protein JG688_00014356 [Phytophthora aleatoria]